MNFDLFETLKANQVIDQYEFKNGNSEVWIYIKGLEPGEVKTFNIDLIQQFQGICQERPQEAFEFYNPSQPIWVIL